LHALEATIDMKSLSTGHAERDGHLHSPDFFDVVSHPTATFQSVEIEQTGAQDYRVTGELTMRGVTKSVTLDLSSLGAWRVPHGKAVVPGIAFTGCATIDRHEFGVSWNDRLENSGVVVGNAVRLTLDIEAHPKN
jgi:polyisoprenoid-binding protein YceI